MIRRDQEGEAAGGLMEGARGMGLQGIRGGWLVNPFWYSVGLSSSDHRFFTSKSFLVSSARNTASPLISRIPASLERIAAWARPPAVQEHCARTRT